METDHRCITLYKSDKRPSGYTVQYSLCILSYVFHFPDSPEYWKRSLLINREMRINEWDSRFLEVEHLKKSYVNNVPILDDVSFSLQKGEVVVIVGPSGCGKSTFLRCINRLEEIDTGVLKLNGVSYEKEKRI